MNASNCIYVIDFCQTIFFRREEQTGAYAVHVRLRRN